LNPCSKASGKPHVILPGKFTGLNETIWRI
jgi:hypothetical protein